MNSFLHINSNFQIKRIAEKRTLKLDSSLKPYSYPDLSDKIVDCLLTATAKVQSVDIKASFLFVGDANAHDKEWLRSSMPTVHGRAAML